MLCPVLNDSANFTLDGLYTDYYYKFFEIEIKLTDYGMKNLNEVKNKMQNHPIEMAIYFIDTAIHYKDRENPLPSYINYICKGLDLNFVKTSEISISTIEFTNDENLLYENSKTLIDASFDKNEDTFRLISSREDLGVNLVGKFIVKASSKVLVLKRSYQKLPSFIADLTGILEEILLAILLLINIMERQAIDNKLIHKMLKIKGSKNYDVEYFLNVFNRDKLNNEVTELIKRGNFQIEKGSTGKVYSKRKSIMTILNNKKFGNTNNDCRKRRSIFSLQKSENKEIGSRRINNYFDNYSSIQISSPKTNDNNINVQPSERDVIQILNSSNNVKNKKIEENDFIINSLQSEDLETLGNKKLNSISLNQNLSLNQSQSQSQDNSNKFQSLTNNNDNNIFIHKNFRKSKKLTLNTQSNNITYKKINKKNDVIKSAEDSFYSIDVVSAVFTRLCYWTSKYPKRRYELLKKAERKVHYYLEIFNYIKGMQEIDLLKYCLFDKEQITLFHYLASPPLKTSSKKTNQIYKEFENEQVYVGKIKKKEIDEIYNCYNTIRFKDEITFEDLKLLRLINAEVELLN